MRAKLALLAAAAIVFAPAWGGTGATQGVSSDGSLAGRILAPTVDEGPGVSHAVGRATLHPIDRVGQRSSFKSVAGLPLRSSGMAPLSFWTVIVALGLIAATATVVPSPSPRAPPRLLIT